MRHGTHLPVGVDAFESSYCTQAHLSECRVLDNGSAPLNFRPGHGLKIVNELTKALDGRFEQRFATGGSTSIVVFPSSSEPQISASTRDRQVHKERHDGHGRNHNRSRLQVKAAGANSGKPTAARAICDDGFPGSFRGAYPANQT